MLRLLIIGTLLVASVTGVRSHPGLSQGWMGGCSVVGTTETSGAEWRQCHPGRLAGKPDLSRSGCTAASVAGPTDLWRCPASVEAQYTLGP